MVAARVLFDFKTKAAATDKNDAWNEAKTG
jgi:hypothetical protein